MKRVALVGALALGVLLVPTTATAQDTSQVSFVHASTAGAVDLYIGPADGATVDLAAVDVASGEKVDLGAVPAAKYRFLLCGHVPAPPASVAGCGDIPATTTIDKDITIGADKVNDIVLGFTAAGGTSLVKFNVDVRCVTPGGRVTVSNVSQSSPATVSVDGTIISDNLSSGKQAKQGVTAGGHTLNVADGAALNLAIGADVPSQVNTITYITGTPNGYGFLQYQLALECDGPPPTDPPTPTPGPDTAGTGANRASTTAVNPRYAG